MYLGATRVESSLGSKEGLTGTACLVGEEKHLAWFMIEAKACVPLEYTLQSGIRYLVVTYL